ncbi:hypothetical protein OG225_43065 (plasmid) [Nocardia sp. NBC_01377]|uniref:NAD(P)/FAD-dependent oxidoreductase n=1 Tax=Nocardia sp. NBC_01377 TaxID=2903595 RepID=UPI00324F79FF
MSAPPVPNPRTAPSSEDRLPAPSTARHRSRTHTDALVNGTEHGEVSTAVVIGGGIAGTLAAWALRGYAERVIVIERDHYPQQPEFRSGVPQARHAHLVLHGGHQALEELIPGIGADLAAAGANRVAMSGDLRWLTSAGWMATHPSELTFLSCTRPVLDHVVRNRVAVGSDVQFLQGAHVVGLTGSPQAVTGVRIRRRGNFTEYRLPAQLVIDASGRSTKLPEWLTDIGCRDVPTQTVDAGIAYTTRLFHPPRRRPEFTALYLQATRDQPWTGALLPVEDRWIVSLGGMRGHEPEPGTPGFEKLLTQLQQRDPVLSQTLRDARPAGDVRNFHAGPSTRRHYEHRTTPSGLVVLGDAHTTLNPVYGQGVTIAVKGAQALRAAVRHHGGIGHRAAAAARDGIAAASRDAWLMSSAEDARYPGTLGGPTGRLVRAQHRYLDHVLRRATVDPQITAAFERVMSLLDRPTALLRPGIATSVLTGWR